MLLKIYTKAIHEEWLMISALRIKEYGGKMLLRQINQAVKENSVKCHAAEKNELMILVENREVLPDSFKACDVARLYKEGYAVFKLELSNHNKVVS